MKYVCSCGEFETDDLNAMAVHAFEANLRRRGIDPDEYRRQYVEGSAADVKRVKGNIQYLFMEQHRGKRE